MHPSDIRSSNDNSPSKWTWKKTTFIITLLLCFAVTAAFVGGYFAGRQNSRAPPVPAKLQEMTSTIAAKSWKEAVCSITKSQCPSSFKRSPLILLSMDGFAAEYLKLRLTPSIEHLMNCGVRPPYMNPVFPTKTFPNHYSLVTGLFPASHGIIDNFMYDPVLNKYFSIRSPEATKKEWWGGEPIWVTAKRQGLKTATFFWPGSDVVGQRADYYMTYNRSTPFADRVRQVFRWLDKPEENRPDFITIYFEEPDSSGHRYGPQSENVKEALKKVDYFVNELMEGLYLRNLINCVNLVIVSDHGMESISCDRVISFYNLNNNFNDTDLLMKGGTVGRMRHLKNSSGGLLDDLQETFQCKSPQVWVYQQNEFPVRWRYEGNRRIDPLLFDIAPQWLITDKYFKKDVAPRDCSGGDHGYDNMDEDMWSIFVGIGPAFKSRLVVEPFMNIQVYNLLSVILGVKPSPNNGTLGALFHLLKTPPPYPHDENFSRELYVCNPNDTFHVNASGCPTLLELQKSVGDLNIPGLSPWGFPVDTRLNGDRKICLLAERNYLVGYSPIKKMPIWTISNIKPEMKKDDESKNNSGELKADKDTSVPLLANNTSPPCHLFLSEEYPMDDIIYAPLINYEFSTEKHLNAVPMYKGFYYGVLQPLWTKIDSWRIHFHHINVVSGPAWNKKDHLLNEGTLPSYFYFIFTFCNQRSWSLTGFNCTNEELDVLGFVLPHKSSLPPCWDSNKFLEKHQASVDVVESITELKFFVDVPQDLSLRLRLKLFQTSSLSISSETKSRPL